MPSRYITPAIAFLAATAALSVPAQAKDIELTCLAAPGAEPTATVIFHPRLFGVDGNEGDGDLFTDDFEHKFYYTITVTDYDPAKPGLTGPTRCAVDGDWRRDWNIPSVRPEFVTQDPGAIIYLYKVPRHSRVSLTLHVVELDSDQNDWLDFDPSPDNDRLYLDVFVNQNAAQTMVGAREGRNDVTLNSAKRVVGDGSIGSNIDHVRAFIEFVVNVHPDNWQSDPVIVGPVSPGTIPGTTLGTIPAASNEPICRDYALKAVEMNVEAQKLGCGFAPPVWSNDHQMHFSWCMQGANAASAGPETKKRAAELDGCRAVQPNNQSPAPPPSPTPGFDLCGAYANEAVKAAVRADALGCGFSGPRWLQDFKAHYDFCATNPLPPLVLAEQVLRDTQLQNCMAAKGN